MAIMCFRQLKVSSMALALLRMTLLGDVRHIPCHKSTFKPEFSPFSLLNRKFSLLLHTNNFLIHKTTFYETKIKLRAARD